MPAADWCARADEVAYARAVPWLRPGIALAFVLSACAGQDGKATSTVKEIPAPAAVDAMNRRQVTVVGVARNAKIGAVVVTGEGEALYLDGLSSWPAKVEGQRVKVSAASRRIKVIPAPPIGPNGEVSAGASGKQSVLEDATWELAE